MADNLGYTPGTGATIAADDVGGIHHQRIKLSLGADGSATDAKTVDADTGGGADPTLGVVLVAPASGGGVAINGDATHGLDVDVTRVSEALSSAATATWTSATAGGTAVTLACSGYATAILEITSDGGTVTGGVVNIESSSDNSNWVTEFVENVLYFEGNYIPLTYFDSFASRSRWVLPLIGATHVRCVLSSVITGTASLDIRVSASSAPYAPVAITIRDANGTVPYVDLDNKGLRVTAYGHDGSTQRLIKTDANGELQVDVLSLPALAAGTNNIGDVDVLSVPAPLSTTGGGTEASALRVTLASDSTGLVSVDDNGGSLTVDAPVGTPVFVRLSDGASAIATLPVSLASLPALPAGTNNIGDVDVLTVPAPLSTTGNGTAATALRVTVASDSTGLISVNTHDVGSITTAVTPGTGATNLGKAEDAQHTSGDVGVMALTVRQDTPAALSGTNADYQPIITDALGRVWTTQNSEIAVSATPTIGAALYAAGDFFGTVMTFANAGLANGGAGRIVQAVITNRDTETPLLELWLFRASPTMVNTDNGVFDITDANLETAGLIGVIEFSTYYATASGNVAMGSFRGQGLGGSPMHYTCGASTTSIFGAFCIRNGVTPASTSDVVVTLTLERE